MLYCLNIIEWTIRLTNCRQFSCVCSVIDHEIRHNIVKVAVDPRGRQDFKIRRCRHGIQVRSIFQEFVYVLSSVSCLKYRWFEAKFNLKPTKQEHLHEVSRP